MLGHTSNPTTVSVADTFWGWLGAFAGISLVAAVDGRFLGGTDLLLLIGSFGASAVLIYGAIESPLAQPRNLVGGHVLSAVVGVTVFQLLPEPAWLTAGLAVSLAIAVMHVTKTVHPPGGATALIAVIGSPKIHDLGYHYVFIPVASGVVILLVVALLVNNVRRGKRYPAFWY
jgi:CBS-domain-containing membrane protein